MKRKESQREGLKIGPGALNVMPVVEFLSWSQSDDFFLNTILTPVLTFKIIVKIHVTLKIIPLASRRKLFVKLRNIVLKFWWC